MDFKIILVDDEQNARAIVRNMLSSLCPNVVVVGEAGGVGEALDLLRDIQPNLLLLDVEMEDGTGFDLLDRIPTPTFGIVFTTAHDDFAVRAFRYNAMDYLLKPVDPDELVAAVRKAQQYSSLPNTQEQIIGLIRATSDKTLDRIVLRTSQGLVFTRLPELVRIESFGNYSFVYLSSGERHLDARNLKEYEEMLPQPTFFRTHQSHIVNTTFVYKLMKGDGGALVMKDGTEIPVSRRRRDALERIL